MKPDDEHPDESALRALFDTTAEPADGATFTRLSARALDVPARARSRRGLLRWAYFAAPLAIAAGALLAVLGGGPHGGVPSARAPISIAPGVAVVTPGAGSSAAEPAVDLGATDDEAPELVAELGDGLDDDDALPDGVLSPASDSDTDDWLAASDDVLGEGG